MSRSAKYILILVVVSYFILMFGNGILSLTNPDEVFYVQTTKEMIQQKTWITPYLFGQPQFEKPILLYWFLRMSMGVFGDTSFAGRFPAAFIAIVGIIAVYLLAFIGYKDARKAFLAGLVMLSCGFYIGLSRSVFTDMIFSIFILFALTSFYWGYVFTSRRRWGIILFFAFSAFAVLAKGPLGLIIPLLIVLTFLWIKNDLKFFFSSASLLGVLVFCLIAIPWYWLMEIKYGPAFNHEFFYNDHFVRLIRAEHVENDTWYFYPLTMIGAFFPWCLFTLAASSSLIKKLKSEKSDFNIFLVLWIIVVLLVFQFAHSKLTSYIFPLFPALGIITGGYIYDNISSSKTTQVFSIISIITLCVFFLMPAASIFALIKFSTYVTVKMQVYFFIFLLFLLCIVCAYWLFVRKISKIIFAFPIFIFFILILAGVIHEDIEPFVSSREACNYLMKNFEVRGPIICSKFYARGVRYYTNKDVVVIDIPGKNFFSPHPIPFLNSDEKVRGFLRNYKVSYGIVKKSNIEDLRRLTDKFYRFEILEVIGNEYVVRIGQLN
jgi:hypothetical protein